MCPAPSGVPVHIWSRWGIELTTLQFTNPSPYGLSLHRYSIVDRGACGTLSTHPSSPCEKRAVQGCLFVGRPGGQGQPGSLDRKGVGFSIGLLQKINSVNL